MLRRLIQAIIGPIRRLRLAIAESDLRWMESAAPNAIAQQRARVLALQARCNATPRVHHTTAAAIAARACSEKRGMLG